MQVASKSRSWLLSKIILTAMTALLLTTACATRPTSEACANTDENGNKSAECAGAVIGDVGGGALDLLNLIELIGFIAH